MTLQIVQLTRPQDRSRLACEDYEARRPDGSVVWRVALDLGEMTASSFREEVIWADARVAAVGGRGVVVLLDLCSGAERLRVDVPSLFGHLSVSRVKGEEWLFVLGWRDVHAFSPDLRQRWVSRDCAVDGITGGTVEGEILHVDAEMDPPGGWVALQLDVASGRVMEPKPPG